MHEILIISNYYPPEKGAAANRIEQLALKLHQHYYKVSILCPLANYPTGKVFAVHQNKFFVKEYLKGIVVRRLWISPSVSRNPFKRILSILSFATGLFFYLLFKETPQKIVVQSPPLLVSFISVFVLSFKKKKIILNVSDLWPSAAIELNAMKAKSLSHKVLLFMEKFIYRSAAIVLGQSEEILEHVTSISPGKQSYLYRNFPDHQTSTIASEPRPDRPIKIFYAGLLGVAQGVLEVCQKIPFERYDIEFHIFGDGAEKTGIQNFIRNHPEKKIIYHGMLERETLTSKLAGFDVAFVPLKTRIYGSVPSKIFEYSALGIPILYFGGGEGETIVSENNLGWVAKVSDYDHLNLALKQISEIAPAALHLIKKRVLLQSAKQFDLEKQVTDLINKDVF